MADLPWYIPLLIFVARIGDVSLGTVRMIFVIAGWRWRAAGLGFFEVLIWALAVGGLIGYITHPVALVAYAGGFASGNLLGMSIERRLALGVRLVRVIHRDADASLSAALRDAGYRVTRVEGAGRDGPVEIAFAVVRRRALPGLLSHIHRVAPESVVTVERAEYASMSATGPGPASSRWWGMRLAGRLGK
ncbi:MAG: DUF5698 domain-containing protein [Planctomycetota bacterium]